MDNVIDQIGQNVAGYLPHLAGALAILIFGWLLARVIAAIIRRSLARTSLDNRLAHWLTGETVAIYGVIARVVFYPIIIFVLVAFFQALGPTLPTEPLNRLLNQIFAFAPQLIGAGVLLLSAWVIASVLRVVLFRVLSAAKLDQRLADQTGLTGDKTGSLTKSLSDTAYWLVWLFFLPALLNALSLTGLLNPVQAMLNKVLDFLPNIFSAGLILAVGWLVARIVQRIVANLLAALGTDEFSERIGLAPVLGQQRLSSVSGLIVYVLILIPVLVAALQALALEAVGGDVGEVVRDDVDVELLGLETGLGYVQRADHFLPFPSGSRAAVSSLYSDSSSCLSVRNALWVRCGLRRRRCGWCLGRLTPSSSALRVIPSVGTFTFFSFAASSTGSSPRSRSGRWFRPSAGA